MSVKLSTDLSVLSNGKRLKRVFHVFKYSDLL